MVFGTGALGSLLLKLGQLLHGEYKLQKGVRKNIEFLKKELEYTHAALVTVSEVPLEELSKEVKLWARDARELSYDMEDVVDTFLVRVVGPDPPSRKSTRKFIRKIKSLLDVGKRHQIGEQIKDIKERVKDLAERRDRYKVDTITRGAATVDPRIAHLYTKATDLVGIDEAKKELGTLLDQQRIVSIVGFGGLGKTTLAKAVYDEIKLQFNCTAFLTISRNPDMKKILNQLLYQLGQGRFDHNTSLDEQQLIDIARQFLHEKRYLIIIDDIWNTSDWDIVIKHALPDDNTGSRIIITTRNVKVASHIGHAYKMQPLSLDTSRTLFYKRIFGTEDPEKCFLDEELAEVSNKILKKCAGVPLAVITIASLLAGKGRNKTEWDEVSNSIGNGMENSLDVEKMRIILSYSYYDLPSCLRTCLLYLSVFPEDSVIEKYRLIWLWVAEGFIQPDNQWKKSLFELGETYFNELINRSMIQPSRKYGILACQVHDMVLNLICSISREENFITILSNTDQTSALTIVRRLSLQHSKTSCAMNQATQSMQLVRSVVVFPSTPGQLPAFRSFKVLRVLDLKDCDLSEQVYTLQHLGCLLHLRYLSLHETGIDQLPESVGNLRYLKILDVWGYKIAQLPKCVARLTHLLRLVVHWNTRISNGIGSLTFLEELSSLSIDDESADNIHSLGLLTELRVLRINLRTDKCIDNLVESLCKLRKIQELDIDVDFYDHQRLTGILDAWIAPQQLRQLFAGAGTFFFSTLPAWLKNIMQYQDLTHLVIGVRELLQEDIEILGRLPALCYLHLSVDHKDLGIFRRRFFTFGAGWFPCLFFCELWGFLWPVRFQQGAMPGVRQLSFRFHVLEEIEIAGKDDGFELGLENLLSLEVIAVFFVRGGASEVQVEEAKAAVRREAESHPNNKLQLMIG